MDGLICCIPWQDLAVDAQLADAPRDQLSILATKIEDQNLVEINFCH